MVPGIAGVPGPEVLDGAPFTDDHVRGLEAVAATAWPAAVREPLDGWLLRQSPAKTRRVNTVLANAMDGNRDLEDRIAAAEAFYRRHGQPPRFQLTRGSVPTGLDAVLADRGYTVEASVDIQIAAPAGLTTGASDPHVAAGATLSPEWMAVYAGGFNRDVTTVIEQIAAPVAFLTYTDGGAVQGVGLGVLAEGWLGIFGMQTRPERRSQGIGTAMVAGLAAWALERGAHGVYLQVEQDNPGARRLYERLGFHTVYGYHYRTLFAT